MKIEIDTKNITDSYVNEQSGYLHFGWLIDEYWGKIAQTYFLPKLLSIYNDLVSLKINEKNPQDWGDLDGKMYYIPNKKVKVIVFTDQNFNYLFMFTDDVLHIRRIWDQVDMNDWKLNEIKDIKNIKKDLNKVLNSLDNIEKFCDDTSKYSDRPSLEAFRKLNFEINSTNSTKGLNFYGNFTDAGYIASIDFNHYKNVEPRIEKSTIGYMHLEMLLTCNIDCMLCEIKDIKARLK